MLCFAFIFAIFSGYLIYLDDQITGTFKGRLWSIPARVYAQPLELYAGAQIQADELALELGRLGYLRGVPTHPGSYSRAFTAEGQKFDIHLRAFQFADGYREAINISLLISSAQIKSLHAAANNTNTALIRLEAPVIGSIFPSHGEDRIILAPADVPELLTQSLIAVEDHNFLTHKGFDPVGILRAAWVNLRAGEIKQGGSTLTQQLVKSYFLNNQRTLSRKLKELLMAIILDARFTKEALLNAYINEIYIGQDGSRAVHGFGLGAQYYFNKPVSELAAHEVALLITIIRGPSYYNPRRNPSRALERRNRVLGQMLEAGIIAPAVHNQSVRKALNKTSIARKGGGYYPAFMDLVRQKLSLEYDLKTLSSHGYKIFTTLDPRVQEAAQQAVEKTLSALEQRRQLPPGELQAALVVSNTQTGELQAVVGGREAGFQGFNRAINASRPIGSLIKPVVYLTALETQNFNLLSPLNDAPLPKLPDQAKHWSPQNFDGRVNGQVPLVRAMADSLNLATAHLGLKLGVQEVGSRFAQLTQQKTKKRYPSFMLGAVEMSPMQVSELYSVFASGGFHSPLRTVTEVIDETGKPLKRYALKIQQLVAADNIIQLNTLLKIVMTHGTGKSSKFRNAGIAGKTGTSDQSRDSWFVSFDDKRLSTVWIGYDDNRASKLTGSSGALKVWDAFATKVKVSSLGIPASFSLETVTVDYQSGLRAEQSCSDQIIIVPVPKGTYIYPHPGCTKTLQDLSNRVKQWFQK
ncbi:MAG: penicillin-binding protein 1B [Pseudomonadales bacterium]|nr:penicillin-binding protein 1B [Pseudomonadales bacterium]